MQRGDSQNNENDGSSPMAQVMPNRPFRFEIPLKDLQPVFGGRAVQDSVGCDADVKVERQQPPILITVTESQLVQLRVVKFHQRPVPGKSRRRLLVAATS